jgi:hypothetical protein
MTHNRLVDGSTPSGPTSKRPPDGFFCQEILFIREADYPEGNRSLPFNLDALDPEAAHQLVDLLRNVPFWVDPGTGTLAMADEPVGAGEYC